MNINWSVIVAIIAGVVAIAVWAKTRRAGPVMGVILGGVLVLMATNGGLLMDLANRGGQLLLTLIDNVLP